MFGRILGVLLAVMFCAGTACVFIWADNPDKENKYVQATQGIRLVNDAIFFSAIDSTKSNTLRVGDLMMGDQEQIFRINEIRKAQDGSVFVVVSWKYITKYTTYEQYQSQPYTNYSTYELNAFAYNKNLVTELELQSFYDKYAEQIAKINAQRAAVANIVAPSKADGLPPPAPPKTGMLESDVSAIDDKRNTDQQEVQSYSSAEISEPDNLDKEALKRTVEQSADLQMQQSDDGHH